MPLGLLANLLNSAFIHPPLYGLDTLKCISALHNDLPASHDCQEDRETIHLLSYSYGIELA